MPIPHDQIDPDALKVVRRLSRSGFDAYLVGGCVRDLLLGRRPKDFDVATSATPTEIKALFRNCRIIGRRFRLAHIFFGPKIIETSTFRANPREVETVDTIESADAPVSADELLIRRDNVFGSAEEDARRRDFTINGLFYDVDQDEVIDYVAGLPDLERRTVRTIGEPEIRFREDPIRILRAIKFAARLDFTIEPVAYQAILDHRSEIAKCAPPRVLEEIYRLLRGGAAARSLELLEDSAVLDVLVPQLGERVRASAADRNRLYETLKGLDVRVRDGYTPSNALLACAVTAPFLVDVMYDVEGALPQEARGDLALIMWERAKPILEGMRASRRDTENARQILMAQRRIMPSKRRRGRPMALARREWFADAVTLFELLNTSPEPEVAEELQRWHRLAREAQHEEHHRPHAAQGNHGHAGHAHPQGHAQSGHAQGGHAQVGLAHGGGGHGGGGHGHAPAHAEGEAPRKRRRRRRGGRRRRKVPGQVPGTQHGGGEPSGDGGAGGDYDIWKD
jgi:poly(A) polymerase